MRVKVGEQEGEGTLRILTLIEAALSPILSFNYPRDLHAVFLSRTAERQHSKRGGGGPSACRTEEEPIETERPESQYSAEDMAQAFMRARSPLIRPKIAFRC